MNGWLIFAGTLLVAMAIVSPGLRYLPLTAPLIYLTLGVALGPSMLDLIHIHSAEYSQPLQYVAEMSVVIALFAAGIKMPHPFSWRLWRPPVLLATVGMAITIAAVAAFGVTALGFSLGAAVLLGAALAPTDPVLATDVASQHPGDRNHIRFTLTCEAGINDGAALPFALLALGILGLRDLGEYGSHWILFDLLYKGAAGVALGVFYGYCLGRVVNWAKSARAETAVYEDFLGLGLIALTYGSAEITGACGFLAVFFAAVTLRGTELGFTKATDFVPGLATSEAAVVSAESLAFEERLSRVTEIALVLLLGGMIDFDALTWRTLGLCAFVFFIARPLGVLLCLGTLRLPPRARMLSSWLGLRGIGSIYYLMYALNHGFRGPEASELTQMVLIVVAASILVHGITTTPLVQRYFAQPRSTRPTAE